MQAPTDKPCRQPNSIGLRRLGFTYALLTMLITTSTSWAGNLYTLHPVNTESACVAIPLKRSVSSFESNNSQGEGRLWNFTQNRGFFTYVPAEGCAQLSDSAVDLFHAGNQTWVRRSDFSTVDKLERIRHWTTRYVFRRTFLSGGGAGELGLDPRQVNSELEVEAYRVTNVKDHLYLFSPDGSYIDTDNQMRWEMRWSPMGEVVLIDPSGRYLPKFPEFSPSFLPTCQRDQNRELTCGLVFQRHNCGQLRNELGTCSELDRSKPAPGNTPPDDVVGRIKTVATESDALDVLPGKIVIRQRFGPGKPAGYSLSFYARFEDPIMPVVFAPGVLFTPNAKARIGRPRKGDLVMRETCLADCPDQLRLQGLSIK